MKQIIYGLLIIAMILICTAFLTVVSATIVARLRSGSESEYQKLLNKHNQCIIDNRGIASAKEYCDVIVYGKVKR